MRLTIGKRLFLGFLLLLLLEIGIVGLGVVNIHRLSSLNQQSLGLIVPMERVYKLLLSFERLIIPAKDYLNHGNIVEKEISKLQAEQVEKDIVKIKEVFPEAALPGFIQTAEESFQHLKETAEKIFQLANPIGNIEGAMLMEEMDAFLENATMALEEYHAKYLKRQLDVVKGQGSKIMKESMFFFLSFSFFGLALSLILNYLLARRIRNPIVILQAACKRLTNGGMNEKIEINTRDELEELAHTFNQMAQDIREREDKIKQANEELAKWGRTLEEKVEERTRELQEEVDKREIAEEQLRKSEEEYRQLFDNLTDAAFLADAETGRILKANKQAEALLGRSLKEIIGMHQSQLHPPQKIEEYRQKFNLHIQQGKAADYDGEVIRKDGEVIPVAISASAMVIAEKHLIIGLFRDISERKKTEKMLSRLNRALRTLSAGNQALVRATEESGLFKTMCSVLVEAGGYSLAWIGLAEQDENKTVRPVAQAGYEEGYLETLNISWADSERGSGPVGMAMRTGKPSICRDILNEQKFAPLRDEALKRGYVSSVSLPLIFETQSLGALNIYAAEADAFDDEETKLLSELAYDLAYGLVALRRRAEQIQQEELLKRLSSAIEQTADIVMITNRDGIIEYVNPAFEKLTGYTKEETMGKTPRLLKSGEHSRDFYERIWKVILSGEVFKDTLINKKKNGDLYYSEKTITPIKDRDGNIAYFVSTDRDITGRKQMEKEQRLAQLGRLVSDMAHEVNNPLMIISGNAQLSLMEDIQNETVRENLKIIIEGCQSARDIIQRLLKFSRPSRGERREVDIHKSTETVLSLVEHQFSLSNITIKRNYAQNLPPVFIDEKQIEEVLMNLLNNAKEAMPQGGVITITTSMEKGFVKIGIQDTGSGMSEEVAKRVFEPFFTTKEKGTGLGLSVCYGLIKAHNGELKFESELNKGTAVTVLLPLGGVKRNA